VHKRKAPMLKTLATVLSLPLDAFCS